MTVLWTGRGVRSSPRAAGKSAVAARALPTLAVSLLLCLATITSLELGMSKSFSCRVWDECSTPRAAGTGETLYVSTEPSVLGGDVVEVETTYRGEFLASGKPSYGRS
ncbi:MAG: hypothetical protein H0V53_08900 [Rubrobacter sp.]|nr:hypothetical protein [Rubrobacter sp.]